MPYDPTFPVHGAELLSADFRNQFHGIKSLLDALAAGTVTAVVVDAVGTLPPGQPASVGATVIGTTLHLTFNLPVGNDGAQGPPGNNGLDGATGPQGAQGEVNFPQLNSAIADALATAAAAAAANSSAKSNTVATLDAAFADADMETLRGKMNELIAALRR